MIVLLDTTVFGADALCGGDAWQTLILAAQAWDVRVAVTEVVATEAVANYQREVIKARTGLKGWAEKRLGALGLWEAFEVAERVLTEGTDSYAARLQERLEAAGIDVLPIAEIPHLQLVKRASARRRPCNEHGDGYRDTLNWLMLLALAKEKPEEQIVWVSNNTADFGSGRQDDSTDFHSDLLEDLDSAGARERVSWKLTLADLVLSLAAEHAPGSESDIKKVRGKIRDTSVLEFIEKQVLPSAIERPISPRLCALPTEAQSATLTNAEGTRELKLDVKGVLSGERAVVEFTVIVDAGIEATLTLPSEVSGTEAIVAERYINKPLLLRGLVTLDAFERPTGAELAAIEAPSDDPGRTEWEIWDSRFKGAARLAQTVQHIRPIDPEVMRRAAEAVQRIRPIDLETIRRVTESVQHIPPIDPEVMRRAVEAVQRIPPIDPEVMRRAVEAVQRIRPIDPDVMRRAVEAVQRIRSIDLEAMRQAAEAAAQSSKSPSDGEAGEENSHGQEDSQLKEPDADMPTSEPPNED